MVKKKIPNEIGELRRSAAITPFGPGSIVDFRADNGPVSGIIAGLEEWDNSFKPPGLANPQKISEPRLESKLQVNGFRLPPVVIDDRKPDNAPDDGDGKKNRLQKIDCCPVPGLASVSCM